MKDIALKCGSCGKNYINFKIEFEGKIKLKYYCPWCGRENIIVKEYEKKTSYKMSRKI